MWYGNLHSQFGGTGKSDVLYCSMLLHFSLKKRVEVSILMGYVNS